MVAVASGSERARRGSRLPDFIPSGVDRPRVVREARGATRSDPTAPAVGWETGGRRNLRRKHTLRRGVGGVPLYKARVFERARPPGVPG